VYLQVDDVPPYITVPPYTTTVWGVSAPDAFYPKNSVAQQADVSQPYGGGSPAMGGWFSAVCYTFGRRYEFVVKTLISSLLLSLYGRVY
jgi:hypothetical protein